MTNIVFDFLENLSKNNQREWFQDNKNTFLVCQEMVVDLVENIIQEIAVFDPKIGKIDPKKSLFRIYRDTRFSKDKSPYKTNFGAALGMGKNQLMSGYYLHIEPGKSFLAGGVYQPQPDILKKIRKKITENSTDFLKILNDKKFKKLFGTLDQESKLVKVPQGFEKDDPMAEYLKLKNFVVIYPLENKHFLTTTAAKDFSEIYHAILPLNQFLDGATLDE